MAADKIRQMAKLEQAPGLAMMCDFIVAADNGMFGQPEINLAILPGIGGYPAPDSAGGQIQGDG